MYKDLIGSSGDDGMKIGWGSGESDRLGLTLAYHMQICKKQFLVARDMILNCPIEIFDRIEHVEWFSFVSLK